jgi:alkaline phosphatase
MYGHSPERNWEADKDIPANETVFGCKDLALQLMEWSPNQGSDASSGGGGGGVGGSSWDVVLGGGRRNFLPRDDKDDHAKVRADGRDLIAEWRGRHPNGLYVEDTAGLLSATGGASAPLLGLFNADHISYDDDRDPAREPSLEQMTSKAIEILANKANFPLG